MNYLEPYHVVNAVVQRLKENADQLIYKNKNIQQDNITEITDDPGKVGKEDPDYVAPPWLGVFFNMDETVDVLEGGSPSSIPYLIGVLNSSSPNYSKSFEALAEAMYYSRKIIDIVTKFGEDDPTYEINVAEPGEPDDIRIVTLRCDPLPRQVITASAELSVVETRFRYVEP